MKIIKRNPNFRATDDEILAYVQDVQKAVKSIPQNLRTTTDWLSVILGASTYAAFNRSMKETRVSPLKDEEAGHVTGFTISGIIVIDGSEPEEVPVDLLKVEVPEFIA